MTIKDCRKIKGYSQEQLARLLDISLRHYQNIENGKALPSIDIGLKLSYFLNVDPFILFNIRFDKYEQDSK